MILSRLVQYLLGFILGISLLAVSGAAAAYLLFFNRLSVSPPKPTFAEEKEKQQSPQAANPESSPNPTATSSSDTLEKPKKPKLDPALQKKLEQDPGVYKARVTWPEGLVLRGAPSSQASRIGGIANNQEVILIEDSADQNWQKIHVLETDQKAWVRAGNVEKLKEN